MGSYRYRRRYRIQLCRLMFYKENRIGRFKVVINLRNEDLILFLVYYFIRHIFCSGVLKAENRAIVHVISIWNIAHTLIWMRELVVGQQKGSQSLAWKFVCRQMESILRRQRIVVRARVSVATCISVIRYPISWSETSFAGDVPALRTV